jgi:hypothetical protein
MLIKKKSVGKEQRKKQNMGLKKTKHEEDGDI